MHPRCILRHALDVSRMHSGCVPHLAKKVKALEYVLLQLYRKNRWVSWAFQMHLAHILDMFHIRQKRRTSCCSFITRFLLLHRHVLCAFQMHLAQVPDASCTRFKCISNTQMLPWNGAVLYLAANVWNILVSKFSKRLALLLNDNVFPILLMQ